MVIVNHPYAFTDKRLDEKEFNELKKLGVIKESVSWNEWNSVYGLELEKLEAHDYEKTPIGTKTVTWSGSDKRIRNLHKIQEYQRPMLKKYLDELGYEIIKEWRESDGWGDGLNIDYFIIRDRRDDKEMRITGSDDNSCIYKVLGGRALWKEVPNTKPWYDFEKELKETRKKKKYFLDGKELKIVATYRNNEFYIKVINSEHGCFIDEDEGKVRVKFNKNFNLMKQAKAQNLDVKEVMSDE